MSPSHRADPSLPPDNSRQKRSDNPCYTCRRRRVRCDKLLPTCQKCQKAGKICLGYKKPLTWVQGVASRGKMMGLTFDDVREQAGEPAIVSNTHEIPGPAVHEQRIQSDDYGFENLARMGQQSGEHSELDEEHSTDLVLGTQNSNNDNGSQYLKRMSQYIIPTILVDPLYQGLDHLSRHYLTYYDREFCKLMVLYEVPNSNPYRNLLQMVSASPGVCAAMAAIGACHSLHTLHYSRPASFDDMSARARPMLLSEDGEEFMRSPNEMVRSTFQHFLMLKQRALQFVKTNLSLPTAGQDDATIAAVVLLIVLDMIELGRGAWKTHVEGAKRLLQSRFGQISGDPSTGLSTIYDSFNMCLTGTCMTFDIMGSTLAPSGTWSDPISLQLVKSPTLLAHTERSIFLGCPAYLLRIIVFITSIRHADSQVPAPKADISNILSHINAFDAVPWAQEMQPRMSTSIGITTALGQRPPTFEDLFNLASAYKIAVTLYATRILLHPSPGQCSFAAKVTDLLTHLSYLTPASELYKSLLWPTFIAGTECRCPEEQAWVRDRLDRMWRMYLTVNVLAASRVLDVIWSREGERDNDWVEYFDQSDASWLFI